MIVLVGIMNIQYQSIPRANNELGTNAWRINHLFPFRNPQTPRIISKDVFFQGVDDWIWMSLYEEVTAFIDMKEWVFDNVTKGFEWHVDVWIVVQFRFERMLQNLQIGGSPPWNDDFVNVDVDDESRIVFRPLKAVVQSRFLTEIMHFFLSTFIWRNFHRNIPRNDLKNTFVAVILQYICSINAAGMIVNKKSFHAKHPVNFNPFNELLMCIVVQVERWQADCEVHFRVILWSFDWNVISCGWVESILKDKKMGRRLTFLFHDADESRLRNIFSIERAFEGACIKPWVKAKFELKSLFGTCDILFNCLKFVKFSWKQIQINILSWFNHLFCWTNPVCKCLPR